MKLKSYFADSVATAMRKARSELGEEAMLLKSRRAFADREHLGVYEVVFGLASPSDALHSSAEQWTVTATGAPDPLDTGSENSPPGLEAICRDLMSCDAEGQLPEKLLARVESRLRAEALRARDHPTAGQPAPNEAFERVISEELEGFFLRDSALAEGSEGCTVALFGPPGSGKTSAAVRLAISHGVAKGRHTIFVATQDHRVAGTEKLRQYASLLNVELHPVQAVKGLDRVLDQRKKGDFVLIDTPGFGHRDLKLARNLAEALSQRHDVQRHLVLPASMKPDDLRRTIKSFEVFAPQRFLLTKLDETDRLGPVLWETTLTRKPISFFTTGQRVPGDIVAADEPSLQALLQTRHYCSTLSAG